MSLALSGDTVAYLMTLGLSPEEMKGLIDRLQRDALAMSPPAASSGINEERERLRNESTYAERKRAKDRERQRRLREEQRQSRDVAAMSRDVAVTGGDIASDNGDAAEEPSPPPASPPRPPLPPTPAPDGITTHAREDAGPDPPKRRGTRLPDDWQPNELDRAFAKQNGLTDDETDRLGLEFRNYWTARSGAGATKLNWHRTWQNRVLEVADRKRRDAARMAPRTAQSGGGRRGDTSFADLLARRRGYVAD